MKTRIINQWSDLTVAQFAAITKMQSEYKDPEEFANHVLGYLYGEDPMEILYTIYLLRMHGLNQFFGEKVGAMKVTRDGAYSINGRTYRLSVNPSNFTTAQYIDFTTYAKDPSAIADMLSCCLLPDGHRYSDGYDMEQVKADMGALPVSLGLGVVNFFLSWSKASIVTILRSLTWQMKRSRKAKKEVKAMEKLIRTLSQALESFHSF